MTKSANKHNRVYCKAQDFSDELASQIENGQITPKDDPKSRANLLSTEYGWDKEQAMRIWSFGPENMGANILVDMTQGVQYMNEIKDSMDSAF